MCAYVDVCVCGEGEGEGGVLFGGLHSERSMRREK